MNYSEEAMTKKKKCIKERKTKVKKRKEKKAPIKKTECFQDQIKVVRNFYCPLKNSKNCRIALIMIMINIILNVINRFAENRYYLIKILIFTKAF